MMYTPFNINTVSEETLVEQIESLLNSCDEEVDTPYELSENVIKLTDILYIYGELYARAQRAYALEKFQNSTNETLLAHKLKSESTEKMPVGYFSALAQQQMLEQKKDEYDLQLNVSRLKYAYDATQEKINAIKKKIDAAKYDY